MTGNSDSTKEFVTRVLLADDHTIIRHAIRETLQLQGKYEVVAEAANGLEAVNCARTYQPDIVLMDISMPVLNGIEATQQILSENPRIKVIALTMHSARNFWIAMFRAGAKGFIIKDIDFEEIDWAIRTVKRGETYVAPSLSVHMISDYLGTKQHKMEDACRLSKWQEAMSQIAGSFCHDIGNYLHVAELAVNELEHSTDNSSNVMANSALTQIKALVGDLHDYFRFNYKATPWATISGNNLKTELLKMLKPIKRDDTSFEVAIRNISEFDHIYRMAIRLGVPLVQNANEALADFERTKKKIRINICRKPKKETFELTVTDNGPGWQGRLPGIVHNIRRGMSCSSKGDHRGHSLINIYQMVKHLGGNLNLTQNVCHGAKIEISLPWEIVNA